MRSNKKPGVNDVGGIIPTESSPSKSMMKGKMEASPSPTKKSVTFHSDDK